jgi:hypothetical protein
LSGETPTINWIRPLAAPYLRGYRPRAARSGALRGWWFDAPKSRGAIRIFAGYLCEEGEFGALCPQPPECLVFASIDPRRRNVHRRLVSEQNSLLRATFEYIRWLTHRHPRFEFHENEITTLVRHASMRDWPLEKREHLARNFFIETLCWLVRSALARKLLAEGRIPRTSNARRKIKNTPSRRPRSATAR